VQYIISLLQMVMAELWFLGMGDSRIIVQEGVNQLNFSGNCYPSWSFNTNTNLIVAFSVHLPNPFICVHSHSHLICLILAVINLSLLFPFTYVKQALRPFSAVKFLWHVVHFKKTEKEKEVNYIYKYYSSAPNSVICLLVHLHWYSQFQSQI
jgi:hypothetical protein